MDGYGQLSITRYLRNDITTDGVEHFSGIPVSQILRLHVDMNKMHLMHVLIAPISAMGRTRTRECNHEHHQQIRISEVPYEAVHT